MGSVDRGRRRAVKAVVAAGSMAIAPLSVASTLAGQPHRSLALVNKHTGESLELTYFEKGTYKPEALSRITDLMRDHRAEERHPISTKLLDLLFELRTQIKTDEPFQLLSGYRSPETNALLRKRRQGVAQRSFHTLGEAADIYIPGIRVATLSNAALQLKAGGVGYYPRSGFVHLDVGPVRSWRG